MIPVEPVVGAKTRLVEAMALQLADNDRGHLMAHGDWEKLPEAVRWSYGEDAKTLLSVIATNPEGVLAVLTEAGILTEEWRIANGPECWEPERVESRYCSPWSVQQEKK